MNLEKISQRDVRPTDSLAISRANVKKQEQTPNVATSDDAFEIAICKACADVDYSGYSASGTVKPGPNLAATAPVQAAQEGAHPRDVLSMDHLKFTSRADYKNAVEKRVDAYMNQNPETKRVINNYWNNLLSNSDVNGEKPIPSADSFAKYAEESPRAANIAKKHHKFFSFLFKHVEAGYFGLPITDHPKFF